MSILDVSNISKSFGEHTLFSGVSFSINEGDRIGLIGSNGCGKTTLLKIIMGELPPDEGGFSQKSGLKIGYLEQHACKDSSLSVFEETLTVFFRIQKTESQLKQIQNELSDTQNDALLQKQADLNEEYISLGGLTYKSRTRSTLMGLGLSEDKLTLPVHCLSGGQRAKIGLAKLLLSEPELILLDEPTNHLDVTAMEWLEEYLLGVKAAVLVISHDRYFLDKLCLRTFELTAKKLICTPGNYTKHLALMQQRNLTLEREYQNTLAEIERIKGIIAKQKTFSMERNYRTIEHKQKSIDRLEATLVKPDSVEQSVHFKFKTDAPSGEDVIKAQGLSCSFDGKTLFKDIDIDLKRGQRLFLLGGNGCGKTTLLKMIKEGRGVTFGAGVKIGYFDQLQADLCESKTVFEEVSDAFPALSNTEIRNALAAFLFKGDEVFRRILNLSGGERARVSLVKLALGGKNLLLLDEPTNHLDLKSREVLENALLEYDGTVIAVSHDRYFINRLCTHILCFENKTGINFLGNYDDFIKTVNPSFTKTPEVKKERSAVGAGGARYKEKKEQRAALTRLKTKAKRIEEEISTADSRCEEINALLLQDEVTSDYEKVILLSEELDALNKKSEAALYEWDSVLSQIKELEDNL